MRREVRSLTVKAFCFVASGVLGYAKGWFFAEDPALGNAFSQEKAGIAKYLSADMRELVSTPELWRGNLYPLRDGVTGSRVGHTAVPVWFPVDFHNQGSFLIWFQRVKDINLTRVRHGCQPFQFTVSIHEKQCVYPVLSTLSVRPGEEPSVTSFAVYIAESVVSRHEMRELKRRFSPVMRGCFYHV